MKAHCNIGDTCLNLKIPKLDKFGNINGIYDIGECKVML